MFDWMPAVALIPRQLPCQNPIENLSDRWARGKPPHNLAIIREATLQALRHSSGAGAGGSAPPPRPRITFLSIFVIMTELKWSVKWKENNNNSDNDENNT